MNINLEKIMNILKVQISVKIGKNWKNVKF